jgi:hypothetical protein
MHTIPYNAVLLLVGMRARKASDLVEALSPVEVAVPLCGGGFTVGVASCRDTAACAMATGSVSCRCQRDEQAACRRIVPMGSLKVTWRAQGCGGVVGVLSLVVSATVPLEDAAAESGGCRATAILVVREDDSPSKFLCGFTCDGFGCHAVAGHCPGAAARRRLA